MSKETQNTRILLMLWSFEGETARKGDLTKRLVRKGESAKAYQPMLDALIEVNAISLQDNKYYRLTPVGVEQLRQDLAQEEYKFTGNVGEKTVNALLKWIRVQRNVSSIPSNGGNGNAASVIESYDEFKQIALDTYERLNRENNVGSLVPIYQIRREIGARVSRPQFSEWLFSMQSDDIFELLEENVEDSAPDKIEDSVVTKLGKRRCYAKRLDAK